MTTAAASPGQLLLVARPLGVLYCPSGTTPENEDLADHMAQALKFSAKQLAAFGVLAGPGANEGLMDVELEGLTGEQEEWEEGEGCVCGNGVCTMRA